MKVLIIEDETLASKRLKQLIAECSNDAKILDVLESVESVVKWFKCGVQPDLIFMDIQLSDGLCFEIFNQVKAKKRIDTQKALAKQYNIPDLVELNAVTPNAMIKYLEFYLDNFEPPFVLGGTFDARLAGIEYLEERGIGPNEYLPRTIKHDSLSSCELGYYVLTMQKILPP